MGSGFKANNEFGLIKIREFHRGTSLDDRSAINLTMQVS